MSTLPKVAGANLARIIDKLGLNQKEFANASGMAEGTISKRLKGERWSQLAEVEEQIRRAGGDPLDLFHVDADVTLSPMEREAVTLLRNADEFTRSSMIQTLQLVAQVARGCSDDEAQILDAIRRIGPAGHAMVLELSALRSKAENGEP